MVWFILFIIIGAIATPILIKSDKEKYKDYNFLFQCTYVKGLKNVLDREKVRFIKKQNGLFIEFMEKHRNLGLIEIQDIKEIEGVSEEYIKEGVTLTRLIALGVISLGLTKTQIKNRKFILIHLKNDELIVFEDDFAEENVKKLNDLLAGA